MKPDSRVLTTCVLLGLGIAATAAARDAKDVQLARQRFESTAATQRKLLQRDSTMSALLVAAPASQAQEAKTKEAVRQVLEDMRFVLERSLLPDVRNERLFGGMGVVVTDGWMALAEDMIRASSADLKVECVKDYERAALKTALRNRAQAAEHTRPSLEAIPRLADVVASHQMRGGTNNPCKGVKASDLSQPFVNKKVAAGMDAMLIWLIARQTALHLDALQAPQAPAEKVTVGTDGFCPELTADRRALTYAQATRVDLQPAQSAMGAYAVLFTPALVNSSACTSQRLDILMSDKAKGMSKADLIATLELTPAK